MLLNLFLGHLSIGQWNSKTVHNALHMVWFYTVLLPFNTFGIIVSWAFYTYHTVIWYASEIEIT